jgi:predicted ATPase
LALDEVDHRGMNLAMFIKNMTRTETEKFQIWTENHFGFKPIITGREGHVSIQIQTKSNDELTNLADSGFGYSQILPIITQLWVLTQKRTKQNVRLRFNNYNTQTFIIEQPELHLHPAMQAQMINAFIAAINAAKKINLDLKIIFETHSRTIIDTLGRLIDEEESINHEDINICVVNKHSNNSSITSSCFDENGYLENWPFGFFEALEV